MTWKYLIKVLDHQRLVEVRVDACDSLSSELNEIRAEGVTILGVFDRNGDRVPV